MKKSSNNTNKKNKNRSNLRVYCYSHVIVVIVLFTCYYKITIHTIQSNSLLQIAKALRILAKKNSMVPLRTEKINANFEDVISKEFLTPLEEARLAIEEIVIAKNTLDYLTYWKRI